MSDLSILERRRIEAALLAQVYETVRVRSGDAEARAVVVEAVKAAAIAHGSCEAEALGRAPDCEDFRAILPKWTAGGALEIDLLAAEPDRLDFNVTRCRYAEMYRDMGLEWLGAALSCNRDAAFCEGYNPGMALERSRTIMGGATHCDFRYRLKR